MICTQPRLENEGFWYSGKAYITKANAGVGLSNRHFVLAQSSLTKLVYTVYIVQMQALMAMQKL